MTEMYLSLLRAGISEESMKSRAHYLMQFDFCEI